ncbi:MAG TPA: NADH dehydrogenase (quinone) subunit D [Candidatus Dormibacteraeota bacterium]|nr:NADH dehydrogenase (quinone) subunit D [Candidatus Dormibacteraeota bacterium]
MSNLPEWIAGAGNRPDLDPTAVLTPEPPEVVARGDDEMVLSMGPQHPSTHGVLQVVLGIDGEEVVRAEPEIGYLHTGIEKTAENLFWNQALTVIDRMDYLGPLTNDFAFCLGVERLLRITDRIPRRAQQIRVMFAELTRITSHCIWLGTHAIDLGAISPFFYAVDLRENILDLIEAASGARMNMTYFRVGGVNGDLPDGWLERLDALIAKFPGRMRDLRDLLQKNPIWTDREIGVGIISAAEAVAWGLTGPALRASGVAYDLRKAYPYSTYDEYEFDVPTRTEGDSYARFLVRLDEMEEAMRIVQQVRKKLDPGPVMVDDPTISLPPKPSIGISMESLIYHFKLVSEGFRVPPGDVYAAVEGPRGEVGYYIVSNGENRPWRVRTRPASFYNLQALKKIAAGNLIADVVVMIGSLDPVFGEVDR